jgi:cytoskeletal protein CcmA (bactofilin family)
VFSKKSKVDGMPGLTVVEGGRARGPRGISMLADGCSFVGRMFLQGESRIGGKVDGAVLSDGHLTIEESAHMKGEVTGVSIHLNGAVEGRVRVSDILHVSSTGRVKGEIFAKRLIVDDGGRIEGQMSPFEKEDAAKTGLSDTARGNAKDKDVKTSAKVAG